MTNQVFKAGDKVRFKYKYQDDVSVTVDNIYEIMEYRGTGKFPLSIKDDDGDIIGFREDQFELVFEFNRGDRVMVRDSTSDEWCERIYLTTIPGVLYPVITVATENEHKFEAGVTFQAMNWKHIEAIPIPEEMTLEQICKELGRDVKIIK